MPGLKALRYIRFYLEGLKLKLITAHQALTSLLKETEPKGNIARWINELQQFDFEVINRLGTSLKDREAMSRLLVPTTAESSEAINKLWEEKEHIELGTKVSRSIHNGSSDFRIVLHKPRVSWLWRVWWTFLKLTKLFIWPHIKDDTRQNIRPCLKCQIYKVKYKQRTEEMKLPEHSNTPVLSASS